MSTNELSRTRRGPLGSSKLFSGEIGADQDFGSIDGRVVTQVVEERTARLDSATLWKQTYLPSHGMK